jgi:hypothetical protein
MTFTDALRCNNLKVHPNSIVLFKNGVTHTITTHTNGDWTGTASNLVTFNSIVAGSTFTLTAPSATESYMSVKDSVASSVQTVSDGTSVNGGNNTNWNFGSTIAVFAEELEEEY